MKLISLQVMVDLVTLTGKLKKIKLFLGPNSEAIQYRILKLYCGIIPTDTMCKQGFIKSVLSIHLNQIWNNSFLV